MIATMRARTWSVSRPVRIAACVCAAAVAVSAPAAASAAHASTSASSLPRGDGPRNDPPRSGPPRILIVGDSISNGLEGSYTWRYRLWQHFAAANVPVQFVGHRIGTEDIYDNPADVAAINGTPPPANPYDADPTDGTYLAPGFEQTGQSAHDSVWGYQIHLAKTEIKAEVTTYEPDYMLVELGFDDLAYNTSTPAGAIADMRTLITRARAANPDLKILIANVVHRADVPQYATLNAEISTYNSDLAAAIPHWSTARSPVHEADIASDYNATTDTWDGLHPNGVGDYVIAAAFEQTLHRYFHLGPAATPVPASVPDVVMTTPPSITATPVPQGVLLQWGHTYGASGYDVYSRDVTAGQTDFTELAQPVVGDHWWDRWVLPGHEYQYYVIAVRGTDPPSPPTETVSATADPLTLAGPQTVTVDPEAGATSMNVSWPAVTGDNGSYQVLWTDLTAGSVLAGAATVTGTSSTISGLTSGDVYEVAVSAENEYGPGYPTGAVPARAGYGTPTPAPVMVSAQQTDASDAQIEWTPAAGEAADWIYQSSDGGQTFSMLQFPITPVTDPATGDDEWTASNLVSPVTNYEYYVVSCNGSECTAPAAPIAVAPLAGPARASASARAAARRLSREFRAAMATWRDPSRLFYQEGLDSPKPSPDPA